MLLSSTPCSLLPCPSPPSLLLEFLSFYFSISPSHLPSSPWPKTKFSSLPGSAALEDNFFFLKAKKQESLSNPEVLRGRKKECAKGRKDRTNRPMG